jgi:hypothetical protein
MCDQLLSTVEIRARGTYKDPAGTEFLSSKKRLPYIRNNGKRPQAERDICLVIALNKSGTEIAGFASD